MERAIILAASAIKNNNKYKIKGGKEQDLQ